MLLKKPLLLLFLFFCCAKSYAATFVVTSNADSGPGTLRDALTQAAANGTAEKDYITFNITDQSEASRIITVSSQLPNISSNLVIDGTTQPGAVFGVSNAKIILQPVSATSPFNALVMIDASGFELYGMYIRDFGGQPFLAQDVILNSAALYVETSDNIQIGAPGKGNVFANDGFVVFTSYVSVKGGTDPPAYGVNNLKICSNFLGTEPDGRTVRGVNSGGVELNYCKGYIQIGGPETADRNIINSIGISAPGIPENRLFSTDFLIENNYFGYDVNGKPAPLLHAFNALYFDLASWIDVSEIGHITLPYSFTILNNKMQYPCNIQITFTNKPIIYQGNSILYEPSTYNPSIWGSAAAGISLGSTDSVKVGGTNPGEANIIYGEQLLLNSTKSVLVQRNSIYCINVNPPSIYQPPLPIYYNITSWVPKLPVINIDGIAADKVSGTATPLSTIELFKDDSCEWCEPLTYFATVMADANGNWHYDGPINTGIIASATIDGYTSMFTPSAAVTQSTVTFPACGNNGSITGIQYTNGGGYTVTDSKGNVVSNSKDANNLAPDTYIVTVNNGTCSHSLSYYLYNATPNIDSSYVQIIQPSCGKNNGSIGNLFLSGDNQLVLQYDYKSYTYNWLDENNNTVGSYINASNLKPGTYHLIVTYKTGCSTTYGPIILKNAIGPNIDQSNVKIQPSTCGLKTGSITNLVITGTGTLKYSWTNDANQQVSTDDVLTNQPAGNYKLAVTDDTQCGTVYSAVFNIPEVNGITLDETAARISPATCGLSNGYVTGIKATNATSYKWLNDYGVVVSNSIDLINAPAGDYRLYAYNDNGCTAVSAQGYVIDLIAPTAYPKYPVALTNVCSNGGTGTINITPDALVKGINWTDSNGQSLGNSTSLTGLSAGTYSVYFTDQYGCKTLYNNYTVQSIATVAIQPNSGVINNDNCNLKTGSITGIQITGGEAPFTYTWTDANGKILANTPDIANIGAGTYTLNVNDASGCGNAFASYTVVDEDTYMPAPSVSNVQLCSSGSALIGVNNASATATYNLYTSANSTSPADSQTGGKFKVNVSGNTSFYITQISGTCESSKAEVDITVGLSALDIANTFTPNGDGINDYWKIRNIENYPQAIVQVFNRYGQKVFESKGYQVPFDGTYKGQNLPAGVYYYIINLNTNCSLLSGSLTILR